MKSRWFWLPLPVTLLIALLQWQFPVHNELQPHGMPLLFVLFLNECGFIVCVVGLGVALRSLLRRGVDTATVVALTGNTLFATGFLWRLLQLYPQS